MGSLCWGAFARPGLSTHSARLSLREGFWRPSPPPATTGANNGFFNSRNTASHSAFWASAQRGRLWNLSRSCCRLHHDVPDQSTEGVAGRGCQSMGRQKTNQLKTTVTFKCCVAMESTRSSAHQRTIAGCPLCIFLVPCRDLPDLQEVGAS